MREKLTRTSAEIDDGMIGHPMWSVEWITDEMNPTILNSLQAAGRARSEIEPLWSVADSMCSAPPMWSLLPEKVGFYVGAIGAMIVEQMS